MRRAVRRTPASGVARAQGGKEGETRARALRRQHCRAPRAGRAPSARARRLNVVQQAVLVIHPARPPRQPRRRGLRASKTRTRKHRPRPRPREPRDAPVRACPLVAHHQHQRGGALVGFFAAQVAHSKHVLLRLRTASRGRRAAAVRHRAAGRPREGEGGDAQVPTSAEERHVTRSGPRSRNPCSRQGRPGRPMPFRSTARS